MTNKLRKASKERIAEVAQWIREEIEPIQGLVTTLLEVDSYDAGDDVANLVTLAAERWAKILLDDNDETAGLVGQSIVRLSSIGRIIDRVLQGGAPPRADDGVSLWATPLGRLIFRRHGFPQRPATRQEAAAILGISRQAVEYLANRQHVRSEGTLIERDSLIREWQRRSAESIIASDRASEIVVPEGNPDDTGWVSR